MDVNNNQTPNVTLGERRVRVQFNPGNDDVVQNLKEAYAHMIDRVEKIRHEHIPETEQDGDFHRLIALAQTSLEESAMWAVKACTHKK